MTPSMQPKLLARRVRTTRLPHGLRVVAWTRHHARPRRLLDRACPDRGAILGVEPRRLPHRGHARNRRADPRRASIRRVRDRIRRPRIRRRVPRDALRRRQARVRRRLVGAVRSDAAVRDAPHLRGDRRHVLERSGRREHRARGDDAAWVRSSPSSARTRRTRGWLGLLIGVLSGGAVALLHAVLSIQLRADQIIGGTAINFLALGLTGYLYIDIYGARDTSDRHPEASRRPPDLPRGMSSSSVRSSAAEPDDLGRDLLVASPGS